MMQQKFRIVSVQCFGDLSVSLRRNHLVTITDTKIATSYAAENGRFYLVPAERATSEQHFKVHFDTL
jgi:activator of HSP90 ATPase